MLKNCPGKTELVEHRIGTGAANPVWLPLYKLPYAYRGGGVQEELREMLADGIIEPSNSDWTAPMVYTKQGWIPQVVCRLQETKWGFPIRSLSYATDRQTDRPAGRIYV